MHDDALGMLLRADGALPRRTHLTSYSYRTTRAIIEPGGCWERSCRAQQDPPGWSVSESFNLDFHAIVSFGDRPDRSMKHYVPRRSSAPARC